MRLNDYDNYMNPVTFDGKYFHIVGSVPKIKKVIFNYPATVVIWEDRSKTVVKILAEWDDFDKEKGILLCMMKKIYGDGYYKKLKELCE